MKIKYTFLAAMLFGASLSQAQIVTDGLVAFYPFNGDTKDYSGNGNDGTNKGATIAADRFGNAQGAYYFDGAGAFVEVPANSANEPDSFVSISIWVKAEDFTTRQTPLCKRLFHNANPYNSYVLTSTDIGPSQQWAFGVSSGTPGSGLGPIAPGAMTTTWTHIAGTYDGANVKIYVNGTLAATQAKTGLLGYTDSTLRIGLGIPGSSLQYFKGWIDDVRIYGRALTPAEVSLLYSNTTDLVQNPSSSHKQFVPVFYPNPSTDIVNTNMEGIESVEAITIDGKSTKLSFIGSTIDISKLSAGVYILQVKSELNGVIRQKLVVTE